MPFHPTGLEALPAEIAIFPLTGALLLPGGRLPLNVFEPRYLALVEASLAHGRQFGMIQPDLSLPTTARGPGLYRVGCLGRLSSFAETEDGRFLVTLTGTIRFQVAEELPMQDGYRRIRADYTPFATDLLRPALPIQITRPPLLDALRAYFRAKSIEANWEAVERLDDHSLVNTLSIVCPFDPVEKQALLEAPDPAARAGTLLAMLRMDSLPGPGQDMRPS
ncbi:LON peptidase substrate-binding domain-containing protein [Roseomonas sp. SSH11]|uniref:LON peptidase substrate-binding domain-containing protein n=1 Tax=Pararoseomonas baculiformis TaxID=2820812 RepID=A0ABS4AEG6_9PROT|nr:LON peptidase substrate-binding domain-containing protein [Pararoseomonas baculiformis]MBP0445417.1 LON peptidase substrate-binding domain-containing protein [Pararoseomonas baculiformis]